MLVSIILLTSCRGSVQTDSTIDLSPSPAETPIDVLSAAPSTTSTPIVTASPTKKYFPDSLSSLRIVYSDDNKLWLWESGVNRVLAEGIESINLFDQEQIRFSSDGQMVSFTRGEEEVSVINVDGTEEQVILGSEYFGGINKDEYGDWSYYIQPYMTTWIPGTHTLMVNTLVWIETGLYSPYGDTFLVDIESGERSELSGGYHYYPSPDGKTLAVSGVDSISILNLETMVMREVLEFKSYRVYNPMEFRPTVIWKEDSSSFIVSLLPPERGLPLKIWQIDPITLDVSLVLELPFCYGFMQVDSISPNFQYLVYVRQCDENPKLSEIVVRDMSAASERQLFSGEAEELIWSPESERFVMLGTLKGEDPNNVILGQVNGQVERLPLGEVTDVAWIDSNTLLLISMHEIRLWIVDEMESIQIADLVGWYRYFDDYDFYLDVD